VEKPASHPAAVQAFQPHLFEFVKMPSFLLFSSLLLVRLTASAQQLYSNHFGRVSINTTYDYVIVGGGTAGLAVAYRPAENGTNTVAVIEAGGFYESDGGNTSVVPGYCVQYGNIDPAMAKEFPLTDWGLVTVPQAGLNNRTLHYSRGKMLGGR
jgi:choline dehydrogenase